MIAVFQMINKFINRKDYITKFIAQVNKKGLDDVCRHILNFGAHRGNAHLK